MKVRTYLYPPNHSWIVLVDPEREDAVPPSRKGKLLGEVDLETAWAGADVEEVRRRLAEHGYCLNQPAARRLRQIGATGGDPGAG
jgi:hypothetical protein